MADKVQFVLDRMAPLLREMQHLGIFDAAEIQSIVKKRTDFEYKIQRRQLSPADYYGYLQYEVKLEELRHVRCTKLISASTKELKHAFRNIKAQCLRHICYVFERALRRFPNEMTMWHDYLAFLKEQEAYSILNTVFGRVLSLHPTDESLWLQACIFELNHNNNAHSARVLFQRALRFNKHSLKLWLHYYEMELWYVTRYIERNNVLTLSVDNIKELIHLPLVVFKHAMSNLTDFDNLKHFHLSSINIYDPIADIIMKKLEASFHAEPAYWKYYLDHQLSDTLRLKPLCNLSDAPQRVDACFSLLLQFIADVLQYVPNYDVVGAVMQCCDHILKYFTQVRKDSSITLSPLNTATLNQLLQYCSATFPNTNAYHTHLHLKLYQIVNVLVSVLPLSGEVSSCCVTPESAAEALSTDSTSCDMSAWIALADDTLGALCSMLQNAASAEINRRIIDVCTVVLKNIRILSSAEGSDLLQRCLPILTQSVTISEIIDQLQKLIASQYSLVGLRAQWYVVLVKTAVLGYVSGMSSVSIVSVYTQIEKHIASTPHDWHAVDFSEYYSFVLEREVGCIRGGSKETIDSARKLAMAAVARCPQDDKMWEYSEEIERLSGNHAAANHLKWKRNNI